MLRELASGARDPGAQLGDHQDRHWNLNSEAEARRRQEDGEKTAVYRRDYVPT